MTNGLWSAIPEQLLQLWREVADYAGNPEACLINHYSGKIKMGLHRDEDEAELRAPIVSVSLGDRALFRLGGLRICCRSPGKSDLQHQRIEELCRLCPVITTEIRAFR